MRRNHLPSYLILILLLGSIVALDVSRRYLSGEFDSNRFEIEFLYSSEKAGWLESVVDEFERDWKENHSGQAINVIMIPIGSGKGTLQVANEGSKPTVWSPASRFWLPILNRLWRTNHDNDIVETSSQSLVISPTVIATWESYQDTHNITSLDKLRQLSLTDPDFTFAHTDPFESNSGFGAVIMEAAVAADKISPNSARMIYLCTASCTNPHDVLLCTTPESLRSKIMQRTLDIQERKNR